MKNFDDLSDAEVLALTDDEMQLYIDRESAEAGIPILEHPGAPPDDNPTQPDLNCYEVGGLFFLNKQDALNVRDELNKAKSRITLEYISGPSYLKKAAPVGDPETVTDTRVLSAEKADGRQAAIARAEAAKKEHQAALNAYNNAKFKRQSIADELNARRERLWAKQRERERVIAQHNAYLVLAEGNRRTAARFLLAVYPNAKAFCPELFDFTADDPADVPLSSKRHYQPVDCDAEQKTEIEF